ncbi:MAG TPA: hypothetical protein VIL55_16750 [Naasia sp.]|jgi:hypothetical protein
MSIGSSFRASRQAAAATACPNCSGPLDVHGSGPDRYWSCASCNLIFLR